MARAANVDYGWLFVTSPDCTSWAEGCVKTLIVTIQITDHDYEHMIRHFTSSRLGYPIVQVLRMVRAPPNGYAVIIEKSPTNWAAHVPDLPGCIAVGASLDDVRRLMKEAVDAHLAGRLENGQPIPEPQTIVDYVEAGLGV